MGFGVGRHADLERRDPSNRTDQLGRTRIPARVRREPCAELGHVPAQRDERLARAIDDQALEGADAHVGRDIPDADVEPSPRQRGFAIDFDDADGTSVAAIRRRSGISNGSKSRARVCLMINIEQSLLRDVGVNLSSR